MGHIIETQRGEGAAAGAGEGDGPAPADAVADITPEEIGDHVGGEHDAEDLKPLLEREADDVDEEDGQEDEESELGCGGDGGYDSAQSDLGVPPHDGHAGEQELERVFSGGGKRGRAMTFMHAEERDEPADGNQGNGDPERLVGAEKRHGEAGQQGAQRGQAAGAG